MQENDFLDDVENFTILENKTIGRNLYRYRKIRDIKAAELAKSVGVSEAAYTKYERGESKITIELVQKVAEFYRIDPLQLLSATSSSHFVENVTNSPFAIHGSVQTIDESQSKLIVKLMESVLSLTEKVTNLIEKNQTK